MFIAHVEELQRRYSRILARHRFDSLVIAAGEQRCYFLDDRPVPFHPSPDFAHWCPELSSGHLIQIRAGHKPLLVYLERKDFWYESLGIADATWVEHFEVTSVSSPAKLWDVIDLSGSVAFLGEDVARAETLGCEVNPKHLRSELNWIRAQKTAYEIDCLRRANAKAAQGHIAAQEAFFSGASELDIHLAYLKALPCDEGALPYGSIVALDAKAGILHYQNKRTARIGAQLLLLDSGADYLGYAADITRTCLQPSAHPILHALHSDLDKLQRDLASQAVAGVEFKQLNLTCHYKISEILRTHGIIRDLSSEGCVEEQLSSVFFPHGLGHMLGLQVHDVGGDQSGPDGSQAPPCNSFPKLRMRRALRSDEVVTIEPGLYFIPIKLEQIRAKSVSRHVNWELLEKLLPFGGIRIEDDVLVKADESVNLTREVLPS